MSKCLALTFSAALFFAFGCLCSFDAVPASDSDSESLRGGNLCYAYPLEKDCALAYDDYGCGDAYCDFDPETQADKCPDGATGLYGELVTITPFPRPAEPTEIGYSSYTYQDVRCHRKYGCVGPCKLVPDEKYPPFALVCVQGTEVPNAGFERDYSLQGEGCNAY